MTTNIKTVLFGVNTTPTTLKAPWLPSSGVYPTILEEGYIHIAGDAGTVLGTAFIQGETIIRSGGAWVKLGALFDAADTVNFKGNWDASTLAFPVGGTAGDIYEVTVQGTISLRVFLVGDAIIKTASDWIHVTRPRTSTEVPNLSTVSGANITAALDTLDGRITGLTSTDISNASTVTGAKVTDALNLLKDSFAVDSSVSSTVNVTAMVGKWYRVAATGSVTVTTSISTPYGTGVMVFDSTITSATTTGACTINGVYNASPVALNIKSAYLVQLNSAAVELIEISTSELPYRLDDQVSKLVGNSTIHYTITSALDMTTAYNDVIAGWANLGGTTQQRDTVFHIASNITINSGDFNFYLYRISLEGNATDVNGVQYPTLTLSTPMYAAASPVRIKNLTIAAATGPSIEFLDISNAAISPIFEGDVTINTGIRYTLTGFSTITVVKAENIKGFNSSTINGSASGQTIYWDVKSWQSQIPPATGCKYVLTVSGPELPVFDTGTTESAILHASNTGKLSLTIGSNTKKSQGLSNIDYRPLFGSQVLNYMDINAAEITINGTLQNNVGAAINNLYDTSYSNINILVKGSTAGSELWLNGTNVYSSLTENHSFEKIQIRGNGGALRYTNAVSHQFGDSVSFINNGVGAAAAPLQTVTGSSGTVKNLYFGKNCTLNADTVRIRDTGTTNIYYDQSFTVAANAFSDSTTVSVVNFKPLRPGLTASISTSHASAANTTFNILSFMTLGTDSIGDYVQSISTSGSGITIDVSVGESQTPIITLASASTNTANTVVFRDGAGDFSANDVTVNTLKSTAGIVLDKTAGEGIKVDNTTPTFPWVDLLGNITSEGGAASPNLITYRAGLKQYEFVVNDEVFLEYHIPHDYVPGTDLFIHAHWSHNSAAVASGAITWAYEISYAKGHQQGADSVFGAPKTLTAAAQTASTTQYEHHIAEVQLSVSGGSGTQLDSSKIEPDGVILVRLYLAANTLSAAANPFCHFCDIHYQSTGIGTKQKAPNFYS